MSSPSASPGVLLDSAAFGRFLGNLEPTHSYALAGFVFLIGIIVYTSTRPHGPYVSTCDTPQVLTFEGL